ncbi:hypothetical protein POTOM_005198 [Populus tomentosa]|uniref:Uncharacterized protein n=1 Tax=Populus tomentosa TaxID=118781 RepID=A0A8X8DEA3_POPTO|nr:hypothetical protein POTOM_005198 [Populus tomentosa]
MDTEQTFIRVQERFSQMLTPKVRAAFEYMYLFIAITLFCILVVMHANYVQQPGCSSQLSGVETREAQLIQIKITSAGLWSQNESESNVFIDHDGDHDDVPDDVHLVNAVTDHQVELPIADQGNGGGPFLAAKMWFNWIGSGARKGKLDFEFWKTTDVEHHQQDNTESSSLPVLDNVPPAASAKTDKLDTRSSFPISAKETVKAAINHFGKKWHRRLSFIWRLAKQILRGFQKLWDITGIHVNLDVPKWLRILYLDRLNSFAVQWLEKKNKAFEPTFLYTMEKGFFLLPEEAKSRHNIRTVNISISARHPCFGNRWQQLLINRLVGYDTILMNSLLSSPGQGYLYNFQTKEFYNLSYAQEPQEGPAKFGGLLTYHSIYLVVQYSSYNEVAISKVAVMNYAFKFFVYMMHVPSGNAG